MTDEQFNKLIETIEKEGEKTRQTIRYAAIDITDYLWWACFFLFLIMMNICS